MTRIAEYPFPPQAFSARAEAVLHDEIDRLGKRFPIFHEEASYRPVVAAYARHCVRPTPQADEPIRLLTHLLYLISYYNDSARNPDFRAQVFLFLDALHGAPLPDGDGLTGCVLDFTRRLQHAKDIDPAKLAGFRHACEQSWAAFLWESHSVLGREIDSDTYRSMRRHTICVHPFLELNKLANCHSTALERCFGPLTNRLDRLSVEIHYLANDLYSVHRDRRKGQENLVSIIAREQRVALDEAVALVWSEHDARVDEFVQRSDALVEAVRAARIPCVSPTQACRYIAMLSGCILGHVAAIHALGARYHSAHGAAAGSEI